MTLPHTLPPFRHRKEAGRLLAGRLAVRGYLQPVVLALLRGGVAVGDEISRALDAPLQILLARPLLPSSPSVVTPGAEQLEIAKCPCSDCLECSPIAIAARTAIVVDDGTATSSRWLLALQGIRSRSPKRVVLALPAAARQLLGALEDQADETFCLLRTPNTIDTSEVYADFGEASDQDIAVLVHRSTFRGS